MLCEIHLKLQENISNIFVFRILITLNFNGLFIGYEMATSEASNSAMNEVVTATNEKSISSTQESASTSSDVVSYTSGSNSSDENQETSPVKITGEQTDQSATTSTQSSSANQPSHLKSVKPRKTSKVDLEHLQRLLNLNLSKTKIAKMLDITTPTLYKIIRARKVKPNKYTSMSDEEIDQLILSIKKDHPSAGQIIIQGHLLSKNIRLQRWRLRDSLRRIDKEGVLARSQNTVKARPKDHTNRNRLVPLQPCPNYLWHIDASLKLIRWKMVIHLGIDSFSRLAVYCKCSNNNSAFTVLELFKEAVERYGLPLTVRSDKGSENVSVWQYMYQKRLNADAVVIGSSLKNQRVTRFSKDVYTQVLNHYHDLFTSLEQQHLIDRENTTDIFALHFTFLPLINKRLSEFVKAWNHHPVSTAKNLTPLQLHTANIRDLQLHSLDESKSIDSESIENLQTNIDIDEAAEPVLSPLLFEEEERLKEVIVEHSDLKEALLFELVAKFITNCMTSRTDI